MNFSVKFIREFFSHLDSDGGDAALLREFSYKLAALFECDALYLEYDARKKISELYVRELIKELVSDLPLFKLANRALYFEKTEIQSPIIVEDLDRAVLPQSLKDKLAKSAFRSFLLLPYYDAKGVCGYLWLARINSTRGWSNEEINLIEQILSYLTLKLENLVSEGKGRQEISGLTEQIVAYGKLIIVKTDPDLVIKDLLGDIERLLGVKREELLNNRTLWLDFIHPADRRMMGRVTRIKEKNYEELNGEIRVKARGATEYSWVLLRAVPRYSSTGKFLGWEGFGVDISEKRRNQEELLVQKRRIEALYEVSNSLQVNMDPALVTLKGLRALIKATSSDAGLGCFYDKNSGELEVVAAEGLSQKYIQKLTTTINGRTLVRYAVESRKGILLEDIQEDERADVPLAQIDDIRATIVMPFMFENRVLGALVIYSKRRGHFDEEDFNLIAAGASQIGLAARQAELYAAEKRQASAVKLLYHLSHELSKLFTPHEVAERSFPFIQQAVAAKRMWLGVVNEQGTHIIGQGGVGPGIRQHIKDIQIEIELQHDFLDEAIKSKKPVLVEAGSEMECSGLNRLLKRLQVGSFVVVPLVSLSQVVGVFVIEPIVSSKHFIDRKLPLLTSMASEIGSVILARRFEAKIADADKMRMAGLLASGVAHNFNNLLQAIMGQASLIEMQLPSASPLSESAHTIVDAAGKGASLVKQLLSFSMQNGLERKVLHFPKLLEESRDLYTSLLGAQIMLDMQLDKQEAEVFGDYSQVQQIITNLLVNAREAIGDSVDGLVRIQSNLVRLRSGEVDPELPPGEYLRVDIEDNGQGMDREQQMRCFEPFFTTKNVDEQTGVSLGGSGLGLSSAYSITRQHGGVITVSSNPGEGSVFSAFLPVNVTVKESEEELDKASKISSVLLYGLEESLVFSMRTTLRSLGLISKRVDNPEELLQAQEDAGGRIKLIILSLAFSDKNERLVQILLKSKVPAEILLATSSSESWSAELQENGKLTIVKQPLDARMVHALLRDTIVRKGAKPLSAQVEQQKIIKDLPEALKDDFTKSSTLINYRGPGE